VLACLPKLLDVDASEELKKQRGRQTAAAPEEIAEEKLRF